VRTPSNWLMANNSVAYDNPVIGDNSVKQERHAAGVQRSFWRSRSCKSTRL
jgi:hypothetical protein